MLLKEDGRLDIERVKQLSEEELKKEMEDWGNDQLFEWEGRNGAMTHEEVFGYLYQRIEEFFAGKDKQTNIEDDGED